MISTNLATDEYVALEIKQLPKMSGKPLFEIHVKEVMNFASEFGHKLMCDSKTFSLGSACAARCVYCYVEALVLRHPEVRKLRGKLKRLGLEFQDVVILRLNALDIIREQLTIRLPRSVDLFDGSVIYTSTLVDPALSLGLASQTAEACRMIFELTNWDVRILTKGNFLRTLVAQIPERFHQRLILGHSTGTLDDRVAKAIEQGTALVSKRLEDHYWLQDNGFRTFGMICPSLPQKDPDGFVVDALEKIRADKCEHVWGEVINLRGKSLTKSCEALESAGLGAEADQLRAVSGPGHRQGWEQYARETFLAYTRHIGPEKLRYLQYPSKKSAPWWAEHQHQGAVLLGKNRPDLE